MSTAVNEACSRQGRRVKVESVVGTFDALRVIAARPACETIFYMERPDAGEVIVAVGEVASIRARGAERFSDAAVEAAGVFGDLQTEAEPAPGRMLPRLVGGFAFSDDCRAPLWQDFPPCLFVLPREQWIVENGHALHVSVESEAAHDANGQRSEPGGLFAVADASSLVAGDVVDESAPCWLARTREALAQIEEGSLEKIVVARRESRALSGDVDVIAVLERLRAARPSCYTFCFAVGSSIFIGSSPEMLLSVRDGQVAADALAGTSARGATAAEDRALADQLARSPKDRREHDAVVDGIRRALAPFTIGLVAGTEPEVRPFPEGFHLRTRIGGTLPSRTSVFDLLAAVHPTPAVCGVPRDRAHEVLDRLESDRGWYTGGVGWLSAEGEGLFAVALRAGLLSRGRLTTWAGAGLVAGSDAERELAETELKMRALLSAVEGAVA